ncbi:unnamed protein product [Caenorhabditis auriculariae]|uniref:Uncharacterized protein n=1 Tax=Caenorhabditis auriculariae TaxID=2777116 RepID=A0A8S1HI71_9PELO|nr:unnamed protein product [Caenorhabditis auriculariae]
MDEIAKFTHTYGRLLKNDELPNIWLMIGNFNDPSEMVAEVFPASFRQTFPEELSSMLTFTMWKLRQNMKKFLEFHLREALGKLAGQEEVTNLDDFLKFLARKLILDGNLTICIPFIWLSSPLRQVEVSDSVDELFIVPKNAPQFNFLNKFDNNFADKLIQYLYLFSCRLVLQLLRLVLSFEKVSERESSRKSILKGYKATFNGPADLLIAEEKCQIVLVEHNNNNVVEEEAPFDEKVNFKKEMADADLKIQELQTVNLTLGNDTKDIHFLPFDQHSYGLLARNNNVENIWHLIIDFQEPKDMIYAVFDDSLGNLVIQNEKLNDYFGRNLWNLKEKMQFYMAHHLKSSAERLLKMEETLALEDLENFRIEVMNFLGNSEGEATILCKWGKLPVYLEKDQKIEDFMRSDKDLFFDTEDLMTHHGILRKEPIIFEKEILEALFMFTQRVILQLLRIALNIQFAADGTPTITYDGNIEVEQPILGGFEAFLDHEKFTHRLILREDDTPNIWHFIHDFKSPDEMLRVAFHRKVYDQIFADISLHFKLFQALWTLKNRMVELQEQRLTVMLLSIFGRNARDIRNLHLFYEEIGNSLVCGDPESVYLMPFWFASLVNYNEIIVNLRVSPLPRHSILSAFESLKAPEKLREEILMSLYYFARRITLQLLRLTLSIRLCKSSKVKAVQYWGYNEPAPKVKESGVKKGKRVADDPGSGPSKVRCFSMALESCKRQAQNQKNPPSATQKETPIETNVQKVLNPSVEIAPKRETSEKSPSKDDSLHRKDDNEIKSSSNDAGQNNREQLERVDNVLKEIEKSQGQILNMAVDRMSQALKETEQSLQKTLTAELEVHQRRCEALAARSERHFAELEQAKAQLKAKDATICELSFQLAASQQLCQAGRQEMSEMQRKLEDAQLQVQLKRNEEIPDIKPNKDFISLNGKVDRDSF